jgi:hypothetical protein
LLHRTEVDLLGSNGDALFGEVDAHPPWIGRPAAVKELHSGRLIGRLTHDLCPKSLQLFGIMLEDLCATRGWAPSPRLSDATAA